MEALAWPRDFPEFKKLDNLLRCGICYDYMKTCMMTSCSHNYCSLCIRKYMQYKSVCPACFEETFEVNLRNNRPIDDLISIYCTIRDKLFRHLRLSTVHLQPSQSDEIKSVEKCKKDIKIASESTDNFTSPILKTFGSSEILKKSNKATQGIKKNLDEAFNQKSTDKISTNLKPSTSGKAAEEMPSTSRKSPIKKIPEIFYSPKKPAPTATPSAASVVKVPCPVCNVDIPERNINGHLDSCLARDGASKSVAVSGRRSPIPKRVYNMMSDKDLRKWLKTYGLNAIGDKKTLINRIQRYTVLYNSECDSDHPRSSADIIRQVEMEEKQEKTPSINANQTSSVRKINKNSDQKLIEEENKKYLEKNKASFDNLIKAMKERNGTHIKPTKHINIITDSDESDPEIDSYVSKETMKIDDDRPCTSGFQAKKEDKISKDKKMNFQKRSCDGNDNFGIESHFLAQSPSPDLSANQNESLIDMIELSESPRRNTRALKTEFKEEDGFDSDQSDDSISLLANCEVLLQENKSSTNTTNTNAYADGDADIDDDVFGNYDNGSKKKSLLTESQTIDPDFLITESQLIEAKEDESEDEFTPKRPMKRPKMTINQKTPTSMKKSTPRSDRRNATPKFRQSQASDSDFAMTNSLLEESSVDTVVGMNNQQSTECNLNTSKNESDLASSPLSKFLDTENSSSPPDVENVDPDSLKVSNIVVSRNDATVSTPSLRSKRQRIGSTSDSGTPKRILRQRTK